MSYLELPDLRNGYVTLVDWVAQLGDRVVSRGLATRELTGATIEFPDPTATLLPVGVGRGVNARLAAVEALQFISGTFDGDLIRRAAPGYADVLVRPDDLAYGAYGPRVRRQLDAVISELHGSPTTRRAVVAIWREDDLTHDGDRPCTVAIQFLIRPDAESNEHELRMVVTMRSQDVWLGVPYDVFMFSQLQLSIAHHLGIGVGRYTHHVGSLHLYDRDRDAADRLRPCPVDRPKPERYPRGVASWDEASYPTEAAEWLLDGNLDVLTTGHHDWYLRQLAQLGATRLTAAEVDR